MQIKPERQNTNASEGMNPFRATQYAKAASMAEQHVNGISMLLLLIFILGGTIAAIIMDSSRGNYGLDYSGGIWHLYSLFGFILFLCHSGSKTVGKSSRSAHGEISMG